MAALIDPSDSNDPIARQFIPDTRELDQKPEESADPIGDNRHSPVPGIVHRYPDRVLLKAVHVCPVYCRFCFRREMVGPTGKTLTRAERDVALCYIAAHAEIREVIMTGGDPFLLSARRIADLTERLSRIGHVTNLRWHTRVPLVDPARVTDALIDALHAPRLATRVAIHANHAREFTAEGRAACARLAAAGFTLLSQTVLLKGVNDNAPTLAELMQTFVANRIQPYYLHHADLAPGTAHFRTTIAQGLEIMRELRARLPTAALPTYVLDIPGGYTKAKLESDALAIAADGSVRVRDDDGQWHDYPATSAAP